MKHFVLVLSFFLVLLASCERTEIEHGFAEEVESVFFNPDTASSQLVSCVMKNGDSLSLYGEKDSVGMPLSITHLQYYSSEKKIGALMTFDDGLPSKVLADNGSSVSFEWITRRRADVQVKDPINHILVSGVLDLDSVYSELPFDWDSLLSNDTNIGDSRIKGSMRVVENVRANKKKIATKDASFGQLIHVNFKRCEEYADVDSYLKVYDGFTGQEIDKVMPTKSGNGYDYYIEPHLNSKYVVDKEIAKQIGRALDALLNGMSENEVLSMITSLLSIALAVPSGGTSVSIAVAQELLVNAIAMIHENWGGKHCLEDFGSRIEQYILETHPNCYARLIVEGNEEAFYSLTYNQQYYSYDIDLPDDPQITYFSFSSSYVEFGLSCIPPRSRLRWYDLGYDLEDGSYFYGVTEEVTPDYYFSGTIGGPYADGWGICLSFGIELTTPEGEVLRAAGGIPNYSFFAQ